MSVLSRTKTTEKEEIVSYCEKPLYMIHVAYFLLMSVIDGGIVDDTLNIWQTGWPFWLVRLLTTYLLSRRESDQLHHKKRINISWTILNCTKLLFYGIMILPSGFFSFILTPTT